MNCVAQLSRRLPQIDGFFPEPIVRAIGYMPNQIDTLTIGYVYHLDATEPTVQSGRPFAILDGLRRSQVSVVPVFPLRHTHLFTRIVKKAQARLLGNVYLFDRNPGLLQDFSREALGRLHEQDFDVIFGPSTLPLSFLECEEPITICADATFDSMVDYYPGFSRLGKGQREFSERIEARVLQRASLLIYPSEWAAKSAICHYGVPRERVLVVPSGANFGARNRRDDAQRWIESRHAKEIRLLFVGKQWKRKGGDIAFDVMRILKRSGVPVRLDIVGCKPPHYICTHEKVVVHKLLSIGNEAQRDTLQSLFAQAHFVIAPSRAEAYGMVLCEANAFGVPAISTDTGGISTIIRDGINGYKLPLAAGASEYATLIADIAADTVRYQSLAQSSFGEFELRLNWEEWTMTYLKAASKIVAERGSHAGRSLQHELLAPTPDQAD
jgi:glycosyltransferase involved in cell wall biosynthesis